jgi:thioredoxin reductase (NADPH)
MRQIIIIGSGPAGYTAGIYAARAGLEPLIVASSVEAGGELMKTTEVENFPGFPDGIQGPELMFKLQEQAEKFGAEVLLDDVTSVDLTGDVKKVTLGSGTVEEALTVIFATGSAYRKLGLADEERLSGRGVSWCATCDGFFFKQKEIAVVGGGDSAMEEATFLTRFASKVYVIHRSETLRASKIMQDRAQGNDKIEFLFNKQVTAILGDEKATGVQLTDTVDGSTSDLDLDGLFIAIGNDPRVHLVRLRGRRRTRRRALPRQPRPDLPGRAHRGRRRGHRHRRVGRPGARLRLTCDRRSATSARTHEHTNPLTKGTTMSSAKAVTDASFEADVLKSDKTILVDFWAEWCGPCRAVSPILDQIAAENADKIEIVKLNVDDNPQTAMQYQITSIPAMKVYKGGQVVKTVIGAKPKPALEADLAEFLA